MTAVSPLWKRLFWMVFIWGLSVLALGAVAGVLRFVLFNGASHG